MMINYFLDLVGKMMVSLVFYSVEAVTVVIVGGAQHHH